MKKFLTCFGQRQSSSDSSTSQRPRFQNRASTPCPTTQIPKSKARRKFHNVVSLGDVAEVQFRLQTWKNGANDQDRNNRTPGGSNSRGFSSPNKSKDKVTEKTKKHNANEVDTSENLNLGAGTSGLHTLDGKAEDQVENQVEHGSVMKTSKAKSKVQEVINKFGPNTFVPHERISDDCEMLTFDKILSIIEELMKKSRDSSSLMRISNAVHSYEKLLQHKTHAFDQLQGKYKDLKINTQKMVSKTVEEKLKVDMENTELKVEMHSLRLKLENLQATTNRQAEERKEFQTTQNKLIQALTMHLENGNEEKSKLLREIDRLNLEISDFRATTKYEDEKIQELHTNHNKTLLSLTRHLENRNEKLSQLRKEIARLNLEISDLRATIKHQQ